MDEEAISRAIAERSSTNLLHLDTGVKVDLYMKGPSAFDASEFERRAPRRRLPRRRGF